MAKKSKQSADAMFVATFGPGVPYRPYSANDEARLQNRLPRVMKNILKTHGWCSYRKQVLWLCDPDDWMPAARAWMGPEGVADVLVRSAFGDLFLWDGSRHWYLNPHDATAMLLVPDADWLFSRSLTDEGFAPSTHLPRRVEAARAQAGTLAWDEIYTYVPALALGGSEQTSRIEKAKGLEALLILANLQPLKRY